MRVLRHVCALRVESLIRIGRVVDHLQLSVAVKESVPALDVAVLVALLVTELAVVTGK